MFVAKAMHRILLMQKHYALDSYITALHHAKFEEYGSPSTIEEA